MRELVSFLGSEFRSTRGQHGEILFVDVMRREPHGFAETDRIAALDALQDRQALVARNTNGEQSLVTGTCLLGADPSQQ